MSVAPTADVKLPLTVKKAIRDLEPKQTAALAVATKLAGFPSDVTFAYTGGIESAWVAMEGHNDQGKLPSVVLEKYLPAAIEALNRAWKDQIVVDSFLKAFTAKQITFTIVPEAHVEDKKTALAAWNGYNGLRIVDGKLDIFIKKSSFWVNTSQLEQIKLSEVLANQSGSLPLPVLVKIRDTAADRATQLARAAAALGIDALTCDIESDYAAILAATPEKADVGAYNQYLKALAICFERQCKDDLVKEAIVDALATKKVRVQVVADMKAVAGLKMDNGYNGVQFDQGVVTVLTTKGNYWTNVSQVEQLDLIKLF